MRLYVVVNSTPKSEANLCNPISCARFQILSLSREMELLIRDVEITSQSRASSSGIPPSTIQACKFRWPRLFSTKIISEEIMKIQTPTPGSTVCSSELINTHTHTHTHTHTRTSYPLYYLKLNFGGGGALNTERVKRGWGWGGET